MCSVLIAHSNTSTRVLDAIYCVRHCVRWDFATLTTFIWIFHLIPRITFLPLYIRNSDGTSHRIWLTKETKLTLERICIVYVILVSHWHIYMWYFQCAFAARMLVPRLCITRSRIDILVSMLVLMPGIFFVTSRKIKVMKRSKTLDGTVNEQNYTLLDDIRMSLVGMNVHCPSSQPNAVPSDCARSSFHPWKW